MKTQSIRAQDVRRDWLLVDAADKTLGRIATEIASRLRGKHKAEFTPNADTGDYVVVVNAEKVRVTGAKAANKKYYHHTGYIGGIKETTFARLIAEHPERVIENAVRGMMPRGPLGREMFKKLKVYAGAEHPHSAQQPRTLDI
jgi:large subunit ribosomal protein L13